MHAEVLPRPAGVVSLSTSFYACGLDSCALGGQLTVAVGARAYHLLIWSLKSKCQFHLYDNRMRFRTAPQCGLI
ncbi:hypothetical protein HanRHA438_Chr17g0839681 [Helianthus annuus]|nr:hypothetical protein HanRHA438_Chr17g0839681 [Helianthus annuus]